MFRSTFIVTLLSILVTTALSARIMMLTVIGTTSTTNNYQFLADELVKRGHEVVFVCHTKVVQGARPNITYIQLPVQFITNLGYNFFDKPSFLEVFPITYWYNVNFVVEHCRLNIESKEILQLRDYAEKIDLVIFDMYMQECFLPLVHAKNAPIAFYHGNLPEQLVTHLLQLPSPYAYVKSFYFQPDLPMTFNDRLWNTVVQTLSVLMARWLYFPAVEKLNQQLLPYVPPIEEIIMNTSILMGSIEPVWNPARPLMPSTFDITCAHCGPPKTLPADIQNVIDQAEDGFIIFSMGTLFKAEYFPDNYQEMFLTVFSKLKKHVILWKRDPFENQPTNVKTFPWLPQLDLLGHPKARLFISHGGMYSIHEAVHHGVPILGIGIFADQEDNVRQVVSHGIGMSINRLNITVDYLSNAIETMLTDPRYKTEIKKLSSMMRDQPKTPLERAIYATEFLLRHREQPDILQGNYKHMTFVDYFCLDILAIILILLLVTTSTVVYIFHKLFSKIRQVIKLNTH